ncbi:AsmA family protein [Nonlabens ponticola]|uniref:DUF748 domain-containing protein n=1 Tax=Nonlabens ponticola TaxID=2496866 RepID=A0A3S9MV72_9FLAO|nr:hypothetical protein [Nonlabens ponticola]AZQ43053.1 hypothetical protein EJ995_01950 [Nonlabens ponticola]
MKKLLIVIGILATIFVIGLITANTIIKGKVVNFLENGLADNVDLKYEDLSMSLWSGSIRIDSIQVALSNQQDDEVHTSGYFNYLDIEGVDYWEYFFKDQIKIDLIRVDRNAVKYYQNRYQKPADSSGSKRNPLAEINKDILIKKFEIGSSSFDMYNKQADSLIMSIYDGKLSLVNLATDSLQIAKKIPVTYDDVSITTDSLYYKLNNLEHVQVRDFRLGKDQIDVIDFRIVPDYSIGEYNRQLDRERDYIKMDVDSLQIRNYDVQLEDKLLVRADRIEIFQPDAFLHRSKSLPDDLSYKPLYSEMLRKLSFDMQMDTILIKQAQVIYQEKMKADRPPGEIKFSQMDLTMVTVGNTQESGVKTNITADGIFQDAGDLHADWTFDVNDDQETFRFSGHIFNLPASNINRFTQPNLNIGFKGDLDEIYFDIDGDNINSITNMKMSFNEFKVELLEDQDNIFSKIASGIANIFVPKNSNNGDDDYRTGTGEAERDTSKSIFNFIWLSILSALIKTMT